MVDLDAVEEGEEVQEVVPLCAPDPYSTLLTI